MLSWLFWPFLSMFTRYTGVETMILKVYHFLKIYQKCRDYLVCWAWKNDKGGHIEIGWHTVAVCFFCGVFGMELSSREPRNDKRALHRTMDPNDVCHNKENTQINRTNHDPKLTNIANGKEEKSTSI